METTRVIFCSDVHLCHHKHGAPSPEAKMERMVQQLNDYRKEKPYEKIVFLGDYSLDHWAWQVKGSWLERGVSETERFVKDYASRLEAPYYMLAGNHEQYGEALWQKFTGCSRQDYFVVGGYLIICCDNFAGNLDPDFHSDGTYTVTDLSFVRKAMAEHPDMPVILCAHDFDYDKEPEEFFTFVKEEKRITALLAGHVHLAAVHELGERAGNMVIYYDGHYSYAGGKGTLKDTMWGFCDAVLTDEGLDIRYVEPENDVTVDGEPYHHPYTEKNHRFFPRRDL